MTICIGCWYYSHEYLINFLSGIAHLMHDFVEKVTVQILYQWIMSVVEIIFLANYYDHYGSCSYQYGEYILYKFVFTVVCIGCVNFLRCCERRKREQYFTFIYLIGLCVWIVTVSVMFWSDKGAETVKCRTDPYTSRYYDFILVDIILGYVVIGKIMCSACWIQLSTFLGSDEIVEKYGQFAKSNTAEWVRYRESQNR